MKTKNIKEKIKEYFFLNPTSKIRVRQLERALKLPLPSIIRYTKELENEKILRTTNIANIKLYSADRGSKKYLLEKTFFNITQLNESGLLDYLIVECSNPTIILFGSFSKGEDVESSDIDLYIETSKKLDLQKYEKKLKKEIQVFCYQNIKHVENKDLANNIINGIKLNGLLEVI